jgi:integrase
MPHKPHDKAPTLYWHAPRQVWVILYYHPTTGRRTWLSTRTADRATAEAQLAAHVATLGAAQYGLIALPHPEQQKITVGDCLDRLLRRYELEEIRSLATQRAQVREVRQVLGIHRVAHLTLGLVQDARTLWRRQGRAKGTINRYIATLSRALTIAYEEGLIPRKPPFRWPRFDESDAVRDGFVTATELGAVNAHEPHAAIRDFNTWAFYTGMRFGAIRKLQWDAFDVPTWTMFPPGRDAKGRRRLVLPLPPGPLRELIARRWADRHPTTPWVFHVDGHPVRSPGRWEAAWRRARLPLVQHPKYGSWVTARIFHDLRRTGVRNLVLAGVPEKLAMQISGHRTRTIFDRYNIQGEQEIADAFRRVTAYLGDLPTRPVARPSAQHKGWHRRRLRAVHPGARSGVDTPRALGPRSGPSGPPAA